MKLLVSDLLSLYRERFGCFYFFNLPVFVVVCNTVEFKPLGFVMLHD